MEDRIVVKVSTLIIVSASMALVSFVLGMIAEYIRY